MQTLVELAIQLARFVNITHVLVDAQQAHSAPKQQIGQQQIWHQTEAITGH